MDVKKLKAEFEKLKYIEEKLEYLNFDERLGCYVEKNNGMPVGLAAWVNGAFYGFEQAAKAQAVPEGFVLAPKQPTPKMIDATWNFDEEIQDMSHNSRNEFIYNAMIEAAQEQVNESE